MLDMKQLLNFLITNKTKIMTRNEFLNKFEDLTRQLEDLVSQLPSIPELEEDLYKEDESKIAVSADIMSLEMSVDNLSDLYFDQD
jgi:hypothetical protein